MSSAVALPKVLIVLSSATKTLKGEDTGVFISELAHPFYAIHQHTDITFASPTGHSVIDPSSIEMFKDDIESMSFLKDRADKYQNNVPLSQINPAEYDAVFLPGGHGPSLDIITNNDAQRVISRIYQNGKPVAAVCHAGGVLGSVVDKNSESIYKGRKATAFSNTEEEQVGKVDSIAELPEDHIKRHGGIYVKADQPWGECVIVDKNAHGVYISGQNPASAKKLGEELLKAIHEGVQK